MKTLTTFIISAAIGVTAIVGFAYSGIYDVSASSSHSRIVNWLLSTTSHASVKRQAKDIEVPNLSDDALARLGVNDNAIWPVVVFITKLPELDATKYQNLLASAIGGRTAGARRA